MSFDEEKYTFKKLSNLLGMENASIEDVEKGLSTYAKQATEEIKKNCNDEYDELVAKVDNCIVMGKAMVLYDLYYRTVGYPFGEDGRQLCHWELLKICDDARNLITTANSFRNGVMYDVDTPSCEFICEMSMRSQVAEYYIYGNEVDILKKNTIHEITRLYADTLKCIKEGKVFDDTDRISQCEQYLEVYKSCFEDGAYVQFYDEMNKLMNYIKKNSTYGTITETKTK